MYEIRPEQFITTNSVHVFNPLGEIAHRIMAELCNSVETVLHSLNTGGLSDAEFAKNCQAYDTPGYTTYFVNGMPAFHTHVWIEGTSIKWELRPGPAPNLAQE